jgi:ribosomal protein L37AE/L43A
VAIVDIACPACDRVGTVEKVRIGVYRCRECGERFEPEDVRP